MTKKEIDRPFREVYLFFVGAVFCFPLSLRNVYAAVRSTPLMITFTSYLIYTSINVTDISLKYPFGYFDTVRSLFAKKVPFFAFPVAGSRYWTVM